MDWEERDDGWFTWFECPNCGAREFSRRPECACCHVRLGKDEEPPGGAANIANDISPKRNVGEMSVTEYGTAKEAVEDIIGRTKVKIKKIKELTSRFTAMVTNDEKQVLRNTSIRSNTELPSAAYV